MYTVELLTHHFKTNQNSTLTKLCSLFELQTEEDITMLQNDLKILEQKGIIVVKQDQVYQMPTDHIVANVKIARNGYGYFYLDNIRYNIHPLDLGNCLNNDLCLLRIDKDQTQAVVKKVVKRKTETVICEMQAGELIVYGNIPQHTVEIPSNHFNRLVNGERILVKIRENTMCKNFLQADFISSIGHKDDPDIDLNSIAYSKGFIPNFSEQATKELQAMPTTISEKDIEGRLDLREKLIYTIDCDSAKDMDDAVSIEINEKGNYVVGIHIADVANYVKPGMHLYNEAYERGTSVYMVNSVIPMLPKQLSNGICSLNPNVDRLTRSCIMEITKDGKMVDYKIVKSVICSQMKMDYSKVNELLEENKRIAEYEPFRENLMLMKQFSKLLSKISIERGYISFADTDMSVQLDENGKPVQFDVPHQRTAEKLIENLMLLANETVASHYAWIMPFVFRIHDKPDNDQMEEILNLLRIIGYKIQYIKNFDNPKAIQGLLNSLSNIEQYPILSNLILRGLKKAVYSKDNIGHFGLAYDCYTHFTSPIRRFPDLLVHTLIEQQDAIFSQTDLEALEKYLVEATEHSSKQERSAAEAENEANLLKMAEYMESRIGETFEGVITNVRSSIIDVKTDNNIIGSVLIPDIKDDFYTFNKDLFMLIGAKHKDTYKIGDKITLKVKAASKEFRTIQFELLSKVISTSNQKMKKLVQ